MSESKSILLARSVQKHAGRAKEKLLQNLGKVDRTLDDIFEEHMQNFNRQQQQATRLQKEFNNYIRCIRAVQTASKSLMEAITEVYESGWSGHDLLYVQAQNMEMLWQDFSHKLGDQVLIPLNTYTNQFPEVKKKIEKRGRKLVDYDSCRHSFQSLQANAAKRRDDVKVTKGREQLEEAKRTYEVLNSELHDELPALYDSRILFYVNNLQTLFAAEQLFHSESSKVFAELEAVTDKLANECQRGSYTNTRKPPAITNSVSPVTTLKTSTLNSLNGNASPTNTVQKGAVNGDTSPVSSPDTPPGTPTPPTVSPPPDNSATNDTSTTDSAQLNNGNGNAATPDNTPDKDDHVYDIPPGSPAPVAPQKSNSNTEGKKQVDVDRPEKDKDAKGDEVYDIPVGATLSGLPPGVLYRVRATYRYTREDNDELSFDVGEVIRVVEYEDPEEQEEGWLMGIKESTNEKGMFPANFTRPI